ncbi:RHS repeat-associated core domain-containing protein [Pseudomonas sp. S32]|uniref:RHS repeat-associated core domain-containing protein n=1 Tax=Pseudomonas sp. S32 TaxID=2767448 RepID=UPI001912CD52|nr:RHS repeat-associated core domain-containing protein [Pseudomonas sp. S32]MBK5005452.1 RHS repeat-associated core domain-containing protein [Pseudomonas sp. S32]
MCNRTAVAYTCYGHGGLDTAFLGFNGEWRQPLPGFYALGSGHRMYQPSLMRFLTPDELSPFGKGGVNTYAYCLNDPINLMDVTGRAPGRFQSLRQKAFDSWQVTKKSLFQHPTASEPAFVDGRALIDERTRELSTTPFVEKLSKVNRNLASHGDKSLSREHAQAYVEIAERNSKGEISSTSAHVLASQEWLKEEGPARLVGFTFNSAGALGAGVEDHAQLKTGRFLNPRARNIRNAVD